MLLLKKGAPGGKVVNTGDVENYLGSNSVLGPDLAMNFFNHAIQANAEYIGDEVVKIVKKDESFFVITKDSKYETKTVVLATGTKERKLQVKGEEFYENKGVSGCAICDAPLFKNKVMTFIGGGNASIGEALHVMNFAKSINLVHRRDFFRASDTLVKKLFDNEKVTPYLFYVVTEILGDGERVTSIKIKNNKTNEEKILETAVVFPYIGADPNVDVLLNSNMDYLLDKNKYVIVDKDMKTTIDGLFAAGDVIFKEMRQIATAVGDGAIVSRSVISFLEE